MILRSSVDWLFRRLYWCAYRLMRVYWAVFRPHTHGAIVAVWHGGEVLLVRNSYTHRHWLPGGYVRRGETGREAARRELAEELGLRMAVEDLVPILDVEHSWEGKRERVEVFELRPQSRPAPTIDRREIVEARFYSPAEALTLDVFPPARRAIERGAEAR